MNAQDKRIEVLQLMERMGGGFASALATAWLKADNENAARLYNAFSDLFKDYLDQWRRYRNETRVTLLQDIATEAARNIDLRTRFGESTDSVAQSDSELQRALKALQAHDEVEA